MGFVVIAFLDDDACCCVEAQERKRKTKRMALHAISQNKC
jgi:hypothetical protein